MKTAANTTLSEVIRFRNKLPNGSATVELPGICGCRHCNGVTGVRVDDVFIHDPELAVQVALLTDGYNLRVNEERAKKGTFNRLDGHESWPDDWQFVKPLLPCKCVAEESKVA